MTEKEKMLAGKIYDPSDKEIVSCQKKGHHLAHLLNSLEEDDPRREEVLHQLFPHSTSLHMNSPVTPDYGENVYIGKNFFSNFNLTLLDTCPITIGDNVYIGPNCSLVTPLHPLLAKERAPYRKEDGEVTDQEYGAPIRIGSGVWLASNVVVLPGVTIGEGTVVGAGSVVKASLPPYSLCAGNPARVIRPLTEKDSLARKDVFQDQDKLVER